MATAGNIVEKNGGSNPWKKICVRFREGEEQTDFEEKKIRENRPENFLALIIPEILFIGRTDSWLAGRLITPSSAHTSPLIVPQARKVLSGAACPTPHAWCRGRCWCPPWRGCCPGCPLGPPGPHGRRSWGSGPARGGVWLSWVAARHPPPHFVDLSRGLMIPGEKNPLIAQDEFGCEGIL